MHVKAKKTAFLGLLAAVAVLMITLGTIFETSTLFFICAAAFCVGIADREWGIKYGAVFLFTSFFIALFITPNKMYCLTYAVMGFYLWLSEIIWERVGKSDIKNKKVILWISRYIIFNIIYIPVLTIFPTLFISDKLTGRWMILFFAAGQAGVFVFEKAHEYFQIFIWNKLRRHIKK